MLDGWLRVWWSGSRAPANGCPAPLEEEAPAGKEPAVLECEMEEGKCIGCIVANVSEKSSPIFDFLPASPPILQLNPVLPLAPGQKDPDENAWTRKISKNE